MNIVCPTVLATDIHEYNRLIESLTFATRLHLDVMDGQFASPKSIDIAQLHWPEGKHIDIHVMVNDPAQHVETLIAKQPDRVILHAESETFSEAFTELKEMKMLVGVALLPETTPEDVPEITEADHCLIFGGKLGSYGGKADLSQLKKVRAVKAMNSDIEIAWDGGANADNIVAIVEAGVVVINVGSAIHKAPKPEDAYVTLVEKANQ